MKKILGIDTFLKKNLGQINRLLRFPLRKVSESKGNSYYRFDSVNERIMLVVDKNEANIWYTFNENMQDWLFDLSLTASINSKGEYLCSECKTPVYQSENDLYFGQLIKQLLGMQRKQFRKEMFLIYYCTKNRGSYFTKLVNASDLFSALKGINVGRVFQEFRIRKLKGKLKVYKYLDDFDIISIENVVIPK